MGTICTSLMLLSRRIASATCAPVMRERVVYSLYLWNVPFVFMLAQIERTIPMPMTSQYRGSKNIQIPPWTFVLFAIPECSDCCIPSVSYTHPDAADERS